MQSSPKNLITQILKKSAHRSQLLGVGLLITLMGMSACQPQNSGSDNTTQSIQPTVQPSVTQTTAPTNNPQQNNLSTTSAGLKRVKVFFSKLPQSNSDFTYVESVIRTTERVDVAGFAIEQLISGPNNTEKGQGLITPIQLTGQSNCGGKDFKIGIDKGVAKLQFCRTVKTAGIGDDARIQTALEKTLTQFSTVDSTIILDRNGNCLQNASGENLCLGKQKQLRVFFPKSPVSSNDFTKVEPVIRTTSRSDVGSFALEQLIAGPTAAEQAKGFENPFPKFQGNSNCNGKDFTLSISQQVGKVKFCRSVITAGIGQDVRIQNSIESTLKQFPTIKTVVLLDQKGDCFNDASGENLCFSKL
jgi:hypothetical protein